MGQQNKLRIYLHIVWKTWDKLPVITPDIERELHRYISSTCQRHGCPPLAVGGTEDHVHLLVRYDPAVSLSDLMRFVKGGSSRFVGKTLKPGEWFKWQGSYGAFSISARDKKMVIAYIENQKQHHADGTLWPSAEETEEDDGHTPD